MKIRRSYLNHTQYDGVQLYEVGVTILNKPLKPVYFFGVDGLLIDTGPSLAINRVLRSVKPLNIRDIVLTHTHEDHSGNAAKLSEMLHVPVHGHTLATSIMSEGFSILPYQKLMFGDVGKLQIVPLTPRFHTEKHIFEIIETPGHAPEHVALYEKEKGWLFSGDMFVAERIKYFRKDEDLATQIASLKKLVALDFDTLFCNHNPQQSGGKVRMQRKLKNFEEMYEAIIHYHNAGWSTDQIMAKLNISKGWDIGLFTFGDVKPEYIVTSVTKNL